MLKGIAASPGVAVGRALVIRRAPAAPDAAPSAGAPVDPAAEKDRFSQALATSKEELTRIKEQTARRVGAAEAAVFEAHLMMLDDPTLVDEVNRLIDSGTPAHQAVREVVANLAAIFRNMDNEYMRERAADVEDIGRRLVNHLLGIEEVDWAAIREPVVVVAEDLTPSDTAAMDPQYVLGFATEKGGRTSHSAIMARSLGIPAVVGVPNLLAAFTGAADESETTATTVVVDGEQGLVLVNPDAGTRAQYEEQVAALKAEREALAALLPLPAESTDGRRVELVANIGNPQETKAALAQGAEGVGLFRTEFLFMDRDQMPSEEEQYQAYRAALQAMGERPVIIRTLDIGGDKQIPYLDLPQEQNPFLGWRGIRMCLDRPDLFKPQLRALWRAGRHGNLLVMFPMVSTLEEVRRARAMLDAARAELVAEGVPVADAIQVGIMVELPSAALIADALAQEVDFFSIGSNDLIQYTLAADRMNQQISHLYQPLHPGVLQLIAQVIAAAHRHGKWAGMCGEMAGDLEAVPILLGLGLDEFSMSPSSLPRVKRLIRSLSAEAARDLAQRALAAGSADEVRQMVAEFVAAADGQAGN